MPVSPAAAEMPGATALLKGLRRHGKRLYLSSATPVASLRNIVERRGWSHLFDAIFGIPTEQADDLCCRFAQPPRLPAARWRVVGDGVDDRESAAALGCAFFAVGEARGKLPHEQLFTLPELLELLLQSAKRVQS